jgi:2'-5' RNA ligase
MAVGGGHTIGVAVAIPSPFREVIDAARERFEPTAGDLPAHVTILAPIDVDAEAMPAVEAHLSRVVESVRPFTMVLRGTDSFRPVSPVAFLVVDEGAADCAAIERAVRTGDMAVEARFPYHPHVTLAHDVADEVLDRALADLADFEAVVDVTSLGLYEHLDGRWGLVREFTFGG